MQNPFLNVHGHWHHQIYSWNIVLNNATKQVFYVISTTCHNCFLFKCIKYIYKDRGEEGEEAIVSAVTEA